jgi:hypothetical protein
MMDDEGLVGGLSFLNASERLAGIPEVEAGSGDVFRA